jgi:hypothetical protein
MDCKVGFQVSRVTIKTDQGDRAYKFYVEWNVEYLSFFIVSSC